MPQLLIAELHHQTTVPHCYCTDYAGLIDACTTFCSASLHVSCCTKFYLDVWDSDIALEWDKLCWTKRRKINSKRRKKMKLHLSVLCVTHQPKLG